MGSVKDLVRDDSVYGKLYQPPTSNDFGRGVWKVSGRFSVRDLKEQIPETSINHKPAALTMMTATFFEYLANIHPEIDTCYLGVVDADGNIYFVDSGNARVRRVNTRTGIISTIAGTGFQGFNGDGKAATAAALSSPGGLALDSAGNLYISDTRNHRIRVIRGPIP